MYSELAVVVCLEMIDEVVAQRLFRRLYQLATMDFATHRRDSNPHHSITHVLRIGSQSLALNCTVPGSRFERESPLGIRDVRLRATLSLDR